MPRLMHLLISAALATSPLILISPKLYAAEAVATAAFSQQEIEQLVAPIALYPDALLAQVLMASTYPLEVVQADRWRKANPKLKDKALEDALLKQPWDASVKSLAAFPDVLQMMSDKIDWTQKIGDAFLAQKTEVMQASQRLRAKADSEGNLKTSKEQKIIIEPASASTTTIYRIEPQSEVIYVPVYNPTVVYGVWPYPYYTPYYWYPPAYPYYGAAYGFTAGLIVGAALWGNCNWGGNDININIDRYNNFNRSNINNGNWNHNAEHRRGVEYRDNKTRDQFRANSGSRDQQRNDFRGKADASRGDLKNVDRSSVQNQLKEADRKENSNRERNANQSGQRDRASTSDRAGQIDRSTIDRPSTSDRSADKSGLASQGQRDVKQPSNQTSRDTNRSSASHDNAFSGASSGQANRAASTRGSSSQRSMSRPTRSGGRR